MALQVTETLLAGQKAIGAANAPIKYGEKLLDKMGVTELVKGRKERLKRFNEFAAKKKTLDVNTVPPEQQDAMTKAMIAYGEQYDKATQMIKSGNKASQGYVDAINLTSTLNSGVDSLKTQLDAWSEEGTQLSDDINEGIITKAVGETGYERILGYYSDDAELVFQKDADGNVISPPRTGYKFTYNDPLRPDTKKEDVDEWNFSKNGVVTETIWNGEEKPQWFEPSQTQINQFVKMKEEMDTNIIKGEFDAVSGKQALNNYLSGLNHSDAMSFAADFFNGMTKGNPKTSFNEFSFIAQVQTAYEKQFVKGGSRDGESAKESWWMDKTPITYQPTGADGKPMYELDENGKEKLDKDGKKIPVMSERDSYNLLKEGLGKYSDQFIWPEYNKKWEAQQVNNNANTKFSSGFKPSDMTQIDAGNLAVTDKLTQSFLGNETEGVDPQIFENNMNSLMPKDNNGNPMKIGIIPQGAFNLLKAKQPPSGSPESQMWFDRMPTMDSGDGSRKVIPHRKDVKEYTESELQALYNWTLTARDGFATNPQYSDAINSLYDNVEDEMDPATFNKVGPRDVIFRLINYGSKITTKTGGEDDITTISTETGKHMAYRLGDDPSQLVGEIASATMGMINPEHVEFSSYLDLASQSFYKLGVNPQSETGQSLLRYRGTPPNFPGSQNNP